MRILLILLFTGLLFACEEKVNPIPFPDFSNCNCGSNYDPVCGVDGRSYLNACLADCIGVGIADTSGNCDSSMIVLADTMTWPIQQVCIPVQTQDDPVEFRYLPDGSVIYRRPDSTLFRGNQNLCRCLPPTACIDAPGGGIALQSLSVGDKVFSLDESGREIIVPVLEVQAVKVGEAHQFVQLLMEDGTSIMASAMHPLADGRLLDDIYTGDEIEGKLVAERKWQPSTRGFTMDLLPEGATGVYRIDGFWYGSTMKRQGAISLVNP